jgi:small GTP-binding protein
MTHHYDHMFKVVIIGEIDTGKTAMACRFADGTFSTEYQHTIGVEFKIGHVENKGKRVRFQIWDTVGQERYKSIIQSYYRGVHAVILCFSRNNVNSFNKLTEWITDARKLTTTNTQFLLVACKDDLPPLVETESIVRFCRDNNIDWVACSARTGNNVDRVFSIISELCIKALKQKEDSDHNEDCLRENVLIPMTEELPRKEGRCLYCVIS